ncbi:MAG: SemiSWEET transporter [Ferruginibacter sp.]
METGLVIGVAASVCTGLSLLPQLIKIYKEKKAGDISYWMLIILFAGLTLWISYGFVKADWIIIIANSISLVINLNIFYLNLKYSKK